MAPRPQKQCIFCDNPANSKEHFWPGWMHELLPQLPDPKHDQKIYDYHPSEGQTERGRNARPGALHTIKIRAVCTACNTGWMNNLESEARPFLTPLIEGTPVALDFEQMAVIARWITLKCIVSEHSSPGVALTPREDRAAFREHGTIPPYFRIYVANHDMPHACGYLRHSNCLGVNSPVADPPLAPGTTKNIQTINFVLGRVFVHLNAARVKDFDIESRVVHPLLYGFCRVWPFKYHEMVWPRRPRFSQQAMSVIAGTLDLLAQRAEVRWTDRPLV